MALDDATLAETLRIAGISGDPVEPVFTLAEAVQYIAISRSTPVEVAQRWQQALDEMKRDGSFASIYARWLPGVSLPGAR